MSAAAASAQGWRAFIDRHGIQLACMRRSTLRSYVQDGLKRPYYAAYMPEQEWALVHWDAGRLVFARRSAVDSAWLRAHEYRYIKPDDALAGLRARSAPRGALDAALRRLAAESPSIRAEALALERALPPR